jgi:phage gp46-like protein
MTDLALLWNAMLGRADLALEGPRLMTDRELEAAVVISLFSWRRARDDDPLPEADAPRMGWWGDTLASHVDDRMGSRLWLLRREKMVPETFARARSYAEEALAWMVEDKLAARIEAAAEPRGLDRLDLLITIHRGEGRKLELRFEDLWREIDG